MATRSRACRNIIQKAICEIKVGNPLAANMRVERAAGFFSARLKMAKTSDVHVVVKSGGKLYTAKQQIKVTAGGCGG